SVSIQHHQFDPRELTVNVGDEVTWTHRDGEQVHSVTADDGSFDSNPDCSAGNPKACMSDHDTFKHTFGAEGRYPYFSKTAGGPWPSSAASPSPGPRSARSASGRPGPPSPGPVCGRRRPSGRRRCSRPSTSPTSPASASGRASTPPARTASPSTCGPRASPPG